MMTSARFSVLAVASEVGSAKAMVPVIISLAKKGACVKAFVPAEVISLVRKYFSKSDSKIFLPIKSYPSVRKCMKVFKPHIMIVGTRPLDCVERRLIMDVREYRIQTIAFVDERYALRRRFADGNSQLKFLTDQVVLMDEECRDRAISEGLPPSRLRVGGSALLSYLFFRLSRFRQGSHAVKHASGPSIKQVAFISETFKWGNGVSVSKPGRLGSFLGFTEDTVRKDILKVLAHDKRPLVLVERMHPSDKRRPSRKQVTKGLVFQRVKNGDLWSFLEKCDLVIGMRSFALMEAALLGCHVASYQPGLIGENNCAAVRFGLAHPLNTYEALKEWMSSGLSRRCSMVLNPEHLPFLRFDADEEGARIVMEAVHSS